MNDAWIDAMPASIERPNRVCVDERCYNERDRVGKAEGAMASPYRGRIVGDGRRHRNGLTAVDELSRSCELRTSSRRGSDQNLRARSGSEDEIGIGRGGQSPRSRAVVSVIDRERSDGDARVQNDQLRQPDRSWSRYPDGYTARSAVPIAARSRARRSARSACAAGAPSSS
jgi:hypothetical protein